MKDQVIFVRSGRLKFKTLSDAKDSAPITTKKGVDNLLESLKINKGITQ